MGDSMKALMRSGAISGKQASKHDLPKVLRATKVERDNEEPFHGKQGLKDQGGHRDKGHKNFKVAHIDGDDLTDIGSPERASGAPSKGGRVNAYGNPGVDAIADRKMQKPDFPKGSPGGKMASRGGRDDTGGNGGDRAPNKSGSLSVDKRTKQKKGASNSFAKTKVAKSGPSYGGGSRFEQ
jgi:hypothetical protein